MNEEELFQALKLNENDSVALWTRIHPNLKSKFSLWEFLVPLTTALLALIIAQSFANRGEKQLISWPVKELVVPAAMPPQGQ